jgi:hypothetical protein
MRVVTGHGSPLNILAAALPLPLLRLSRYDGAVRLHHIRCITGQFSARPLKSHGK